jgi:hypothetical protein
MKVDEAQNFLWDGQHNGTAEASESNDLHRIRSLWISITASRLFIGGLGAVAGSARIAVFSASKFQLQACPRNTGVPAWITLVASVID